MVQQVSSCLQFLTCLWLIDADNSAEGILACPIAYPSNATSVSYQVFAKTPAFNLTNCVTLSGFLATYLPSVYPYGAWQYI